MCFDSKLVRLEAVYKGEYNFDKEIFPFQTGSIKRCTIWKTKHLRTRNFHSKLVRLKVRGDEDVGNRREVSIPKWFD